MMGLWLTTAGLLLDIVGVWILACGVIVTNEKAARLASTRVNGNKVLEKQFLQDARDARRGVCILIVGFILQIVGAWVSNG